MAGREVLVLEIGVRVPIPEQPEVRSLKETCHGES